MDKIDKILVTGASGLVGRNLVLHLLSKGYQHVLTPSSHECNFADRERTEHYMAEHKPMYVFHTAGFVRGIMGNLLNQGEAWLQNTLINANIIEASRKISVRKIVAMGTVAMYPDPLPSNPLKEDDLWKGKPHFSEFGYAMAKRGMLAQLEVYKESFGLDYACLLSTNLFGPHDRFDIETGHVVPSLIKKFYDAQKSGGNIVVWGDGSSQRDFLYVVDAINALMITMEHLTGALNMATGISTPIRAVVDALADYTGLGSKVTWDTTKPAGQSFRAYDVSLLHEAGFACAYTLPAALKETFDWYRANEATARH